MRLLLEGERATLRPDGCIGERDGSGGEGVGSDEIEGELVRQAVEEGCASAEGKRIDEDL